METPLKSLLNSLLAAARNKSPGARLADVVDVVLARPRAVPALPTLARQHSERIAVRLRNPDGFRVDEADGRIRLRQWSQWHAQVSELVRGDGVDLLDEIMQTEPYDAERFEALAERISAVLRALRGLNLPWWQTCGIDPSTGMNWSLIELCERRLGKIETMALKRSWN